MNPAAAKIASAPEMPRPGLRRAGPQGRQCVVRSSCGFRSRELWKVNSKDHAVAAPSSDVHAGNDLGNRATPLSGTQLNCGSRENHHVRPGFAGQPADRAGYIPQVQILSARQIVPDLLMQVRDVFASVRVVHHVARWRGRPRRNDRAQSGAGSRSSRSAAMPSPDT